MEPIHMAQSWRVRGGCLKTNLYYLFVKVGGASSVDLENNRLKTSAFTQVAANFDRVRENSRNVVALNLAYNALSAKGKILQCVCESLVSLERLHLQYNIMDEWMHSAKLETLVYLDVSYNRLVVCSDLTRALDSCPRLRVLRADCVCMSTENGIKLAARLADNNTTVRVISVRYNALGNEFARAFASALRTNSILRHARIDKNGFDACGWRVLSKSVIESSSLVKFGVDAHAPEHRGKKYVLRIQRWLETVKEREEKIY
jgi:hypothetical protein